MKGRASPLALCTPAPSEAAIRGGLDRVLPYRPLPGSEILTAAWPARHTSRSAPQRGWVEAVVRRVMEVG
jgi:hypothetical protein